MGFATFLRGKDGSGKLTSYLGTPGYFAPEVILQHPYEGHLVDLFSAAVIHYMMRCAL